MSSMAAGGAGFRWRELAQPTPAAILLLSVVLNLWGGFAVDWWHPDEITPGVVKMMLERDLSPPFLAYGSLHYYVLMLFILPFGLLAKALTADPEAQRAAVMFGGRLLSALMGAGCAGCALVIGRSLFGRPVGLLAALLTALSAGLVILAHFATTAVAGAFWFSASLAMSALYLSGGRSRQLLLAGLLAGLAAATKYVGGLALLGALAAFFLSAGRPLAWARWWGCVAAAALAFVLANPALLVSSCEFLQGFLLENRYNQLRNLDGPLAFAPLLRDLATGLGWAAWAAALAGLLHAIVSLARGHDWRPLVMLLVPALAYYLLLGSHHWSGVRYGLPLIPILAVLTARLLADMASPARPALVRKGAIAAAAAVVLLSGAATVGALLQLSNDSRLLARAWILDNVPAGSTLEMTEYSPRLPKDLYQVVAIPARSSQGTLDSLESDPVYLRLSALLARYFDVAEALGACDGNRPYYRGWAEQRQQHYAEAIRSIAPSLTDLEARAPDFVVISSFYYDRFQDDPDAPEHQLFRELIDGRTAYREVARFHYASELWPTVRWPCCTLNPDVIIFRRDVRQSDARDDLS